MYRFREIAWNIGLALAAFSLCRLLFIVFNGELLTNSNFGAVIFSLIHGIRFDAAYLAYALSLYLVISFFPLGNEKSAPFLKGFYIFSLSLSILPNLIDIEYIKFSGRRMSSEIFTITDDIGNQSFQLIVNYWFIVLFFIAFVYSINKLYKPLKVSKNNTKYKIFKFITFAIILVFTIRGGFQLRPLQPFHAFKSHSENLAKITLNSSFTIIHSLEKKKLKKYSFYKSDKEALKIIKSYQSLPKEKKKQDKTNVVLIILESFTTEYTGLEDSISYTPFLKSIAEKGIFFTNHYANGKRSVEALPPLFCGIPNLQNEAFIHSNYQSNRLKGLPSELNKNGYHTAFFHGGKNGTFSFDAMAKKAGFEEYYGMNEYANNDDYDGTWGIYDDKFFSFYADKINYFKEPFFTSIFTLSSHNPYKIPKEYENTFPKGTKDIHESIGYTDNSLKLFFEKAKKTDWYKNTLFIITADHSQQSHSGKYHSYLGWYDIPMIMYHPSEELTVQNKDGIYQHKDVSKTILNYLGLNSEKFIFSNDILSNSEKGYGIIYESNIYRIFDDKYSIKFNGEEFMHYLKTDPFEKKPIKKNDESGKLENLLKAIIQVYNDKMIDNRF